MPTASPDGSPAGTTITPQQLNLPKGGGAIEGIGEQFQPDYFTGTAALSIPIATSPCRNITPDLSISYSSAAGNGTFGLGWGIAVPSISRKTSKGIPRYTNNDIFVLSGADDLVPEATSTLEGNYRITCYRPRNEGAFSRIQRWEHQEEPADTYWVVTTADHVTSIFGKSPDARITAPNHPENIFSWLLEETYNSEGDHQLFQYEGDDNTNISHQRSTNANRYLKRIWYGQKAALEESMVLSKQVPHANDWHFEVVFDYSGYDLSSPTAEVYQAVTETVEYREDAFSNYLAGFEIRTTRLCRGILMFHRLNDLNDGAPTLVNASELHYDNAPHLSKLIAVTQHGYSWKNTNTCEHLATPAIALAYTPFAPDGTFKNIVQEGGTLLSGLNTDRYQWVGLYGEGIAGTLQMNEQGAWYAAPMGAYVPQEAAPVSNPIELPKGTDYALAPWALIDQFPDVGNMEQATLDNVTGSGRLDVVVSSPAQHGFWEMDFRDEWQPFQPFQQFPADANAPQVQQVDMSGNGLNDWVQINATSIKITPSIGTEGYGTPYEVLQFPEAFPPAMGEAATKSVRFANMSGGGLQDVVEVQANSIVYWPNLGYGHFGAPIAMSNAPNFGDDFNTAQLFLADIDGSGTQDVIYLTTHQAYVWMNNSGNGFADPFTIDLPCSYSNIDHVQFADVTGKGIQSMVISYRTGTNEDNAPMHVYCDFGQHEKPYLLQQINNNMGAITTISYASSVDYYLQDQRHGLPWITHLPFPVQVVQQVTVHDQISGAKHSSLSSYHHGYYDGIEREFRGFGRVDVQTEEVFEDENGAHYSPPAKSVTWFHPGVNAAEWQALKAQYEKEYFSGDAAAWQLPDTFFDWNGHALNPTIQQQAHAALAGHVLRAEVYGLDDSEQCNIPYTVSENNYTVQLLQPPEGHQFGVFMTTDREQLDYDYERIASDPQVHHAFTLKVDEFGNELLGANIAYPRRPDQEHLFPAQQVLHFTYATSDYINDTDHWLIGINWQSQSFEIASASNAYEQWHFNDALHLIDTTEESRLLGHHVALFAELDTNGSTVALPPGVVALPLLPYQNKVLEFSPQQLEEAFGGQLENLPAMLKEGMYEEDEDGRWWNPGWHQEYYGAAHYYMPQCTVDPEHHKTTYTYDAEVLYLKQVTNALQQTVAVDRFDPQHLIPTRLIDLNNNTSEIRLDALGRVVFTSFYGTELDADDVSSAVGFAPVLARDIPTPDGLPTVIDSAPTLLGNTQSYFFYDLFAWQNDQQPVYNISVAAQHYPTAEEQPMETLHIGLSRSDGFGRLLEAKARIESAQLTTQEQQAMNSSYCWLTSGRVEYNNKGLPVRQWEPYASNTPDYISNNKAVQVGVSSMLFYDPLDRNNKVITAKGFLEKHTWTAWENNTYDANNLLLQSPWWEVNVTTPDEDAIYYDAEVANDPAAIERLEAIAAVCHQCHVTDYLDNLDNTIVHRQRLRTPATVNEAPELLDTIVEFDVQGRELCSIDPRLHQTNVEQQLEGDARHTNFRFRYGYGPEALQVQSADAGTHYTLLNIAGHPCFLLDARNTLTTYQYDALHRPTIVEVQNEALQLNNVVEQMEYGNALDKKDAQQRNLLGQLHCTYDQAGKHTTEKISITGGALLATTALRKTYQQEANWTGDEPLMKPRNSSATYDAVGRIITETDVLGNTTQPSYYLSGLVRALQITHQQETVDYVANMRYNAKSQRKTLTRGNGTQTAYHYDPRTFAVTKILTQATDQTGGEDFSQYDRYAYDPVGNVIVKQDHTMATVHFRNAKVTPANQYMFDSLYRLVEAQGRQQVQEPTSVAQHLGRKHHAHDLNALENYIERYTYDTAGNLYELQRQANGNSVGSYTTRLVVSNTSNRAIDAALHTGLTPDEVDRYFDAAGNQLETGKAMQLQWNYRNNIAAVDFEAGNKSYYVYNGTGQRTRKVVEDHSGSAVKITETLYFGAAEIHRRYTGTTLEEERHTLRISDGEHPLAVYHSWEDLPQQTTRTPITWYQLSDMQDSVNVLLNEYGDVLSREEYSPYGQTTYTDESGTTLELNTHKYCNKELDKGTGFYYYGLRYYQSHLGRWLSTDPAGTIDGLNLYAFVSNNPVTLVDVGGMAGKGKQGPRAKKADELGAKKSKRVKTQVKSIQTFLDVVIKEEIALQKAANLLKSDSKAKVSPEVEKLLRYDPKKKARISEAKIASALEDTRNAITQSRYNINRLDPPAITGGVSPIPTAIGVPTSDITTNPTTRVGKSFQLMKGSINVGARTADLSTVMRDTNRGYSADDYSAQMIPAPVPGTPPSPAHDKSWCHVWAHCLGGDDSIDNLLAGSQPSNLTQLKIESYLHNEIKKSTEPAGSQTVLFSVEAGADVYEDSGTATHYASRFFYKVWEGDDKTVPPIIDETFDAQAHGTVNLNSLIQLKK